VRARRGPVFVLHRPRCSAASSGCSSPCSFSRGSARHNVRLE
jgi:hypothetical protein